MKSKEFLKKCVESSSMNKFDLGVPTPILVMLGRDVNSCPIFSLSQVYKENAFKSSLAIEVTSKNQKEMGFRYDFKLRDNQYLDLFCKVIDDLLSAASQEKDKTKYVNRLISRYKSWLHFWKKDTSSLSMAEKQGIFGELVYIDNQLKNGADPEKLIRSWRGPEKADQDFIEEGFWAEIKTIEVSKECITISSLQQLDNPSEIKDGTLSKVEGRLVVFKINQNTALHNPLSIFKLIQSIRAKLEENPVALDIFNHDLVLCGILSEEDEKNNFTAEVVSCVQYRANSSSFPKFRSCDVNSAVTALTYCLSLAGIEPWRIDNDQ